MNKTFIICCCDKTANELREKGIETRDGLIVTNDYDDLVRQIKKTGGICSIFLEDLYPEAKSGEENHINEIALRINKLKPNTSLFVLEQSNTPRSPYVFKGSLQLDGVLSIVTQ